MEDTLQAIWPLTYMLLFLRRIQSRSVLKSLEETEELIMIIQILVVLVLIILCLVQGIKTQTKQISAYCSDNT